jgi:type II restriction enzyme
LGFEEAQTPFESASQNARVWTEAWVRRSLYCPNCGNANVDQFANNRPAADFVCKSCQEQYELKAKKGKFGSKVVDGAFRTMQERLSEDTNPNFAFLSYNLAQRRVVNLFVVPKQFVVPEVIEKRRPLPPTARRAGWVGCNLRLKGLPELGRVHIVREGIVTAKDLVLQQWQKSLFLRSKDIAARGWLVEVMACCDTIGRREFNLEDVYGFEPTLSALYPENRHVKEKIRQQLQVLREAGYLEFLGRGRYRLR